MEFVESRAKRLTPDQAQVYLDSTYDLQRKLRKGHVDQFARAMVAGKMPFVSVTLAQHNGHELLVDGQHRLAAMVENGVTLPAIITRVKCNSDAETAEFYQHISTEMSRSRGDIMRAWVEFSFLQGQDKLLCGYVYSGINFLYSRHGPRSDEGEKFRGGWMGTMTIPERLGLVEEHSVACNIAIGILKKYAGKKLETRPFKRASVVAAMITTAEKAPEEHEEFWGPVITGENLTRDDARMRLRSFLTTTAPRAGGWIEGKVCYGKAIGAWNNWRRGQEVGTLKFIASWDYQKPI